MNKELIKRISIGVSDFKSMIKRKSVYIDKTLFIKDLLDYGTEVSLILRPRRFGKTLNMSMLKYFFDCTDSNSELFRSLNISKYPECMKHQGKYPVIFVTLKDVKYNTWEDTYSTICSLIQDLYIQYKYLLDDDELEEEYKRYFNSILSLTGSLSDYSLSLKRLAYFLYKHFNQEVVILIDEYDTLIQSGFANGFYDKAINFMRNWLSGALKDAYYLKFSILTGILRVSKESIFSGLNNIEVFSPLKSEFAEYFGFVDLEIRHMIKDFECENYYSSIKYWYDGYRFGDLEVYNPFSVMSYFRNKCQFEAYWVNTSENSVIRDMLRHFSNAIVEDLTYLLEGKSLIRKVNINAEYNSIYTNESSLYGFLILTGYLKGSKFKSEDLNSSVYSLSVPNTEITELYKSEVLDYIVQDLKYAELNTITNSLLRNDLITFSSSLQDFLVKSVSYLDSSESFYHGLMLGLLASLSNVYVIKSNRESGYGRFDIMLIPRTSRFRAIIMEFKYSKDVASMNTDANNALQQIDNKEYDMELKDIKIVNPIKYGIAFHGKDVSIITNIHDITK